MFIDEETLFELLYGLATIHDLLADAHKEADTRFEALRNAIRREGLGKKWEEYLLEQESN